MRLPLLLLGGGGCGVAVVGSGQLRWISNLGILESWRGEVSRDLRAAVVRGEEVRKSMLL